MLCSGRCVRRVVCAANKRPHRKRDESSGDSGYSCLPLSAFSVELGNCAHRGLGGGFMPSASNLARRRWLGAHGPLTRPLMHPNPGVTHASLASATRCIVGAAKISGEKKRFCAGQRILVITGTTRERALQPWPNRTYRERAPSLNTFSCLQTTAPLNFRLGLSKELAKFRDQDRE
ncbi:hypothetical protein MRX96_010515 [Rhipicephalus microplus]